MRTQNAPALVQLLHLQGAELRAQSRLGTKVRVGQGLLLGAQARPDGVGPQKPQAGGDVQRVFKTRIDLLDVGAQGFKLFDRIGHGRCDFGVHVLRKAQGGGVGDSKAANAVFQAHGVIGGVRWQRSPVAGIGLLEHIRHQGGIAHAHGVGAKVRHRAERRQGVGGYAPKTGLEAHVAAKGGGYAHAARAIGAHTQWPQACGYSGSGAPRRPTGCVVQVPGVARDAGGRRVGLALATKFGGRGFAQQHGARLAQARRGRGIDLPGLVRVDGAAAAKGGPASGQDQILDGGGHALEGAHRRALLPMRLPACLAGARTGQSGLFVDQTKGVDLGVDPFDAL